MKKLVTSMLIVAKHKKESIQHMHYMRGVIAILLCSMLFLWGCKKDTHTDHTDSASSQGTGLIFLDPAIYDTMEKVQAPVTGGDELPPSFFLVVPEHAFNQGSQGSCASCASAMAKSIMDHRDYGAAFISDGIIYSPSFLYNQCKLPGTCKDAGSTIDANLGLLQTIGDCNISDMGYDEFDCTTKPTGAQRSRALAHLIAEHHPVSLDAAAIKYVIHQGRPVVVAFNITAPYWTDYFFNPDNVDMVWTSPGTLTGISHATILYGWDDGKHAFRMLNSWGNGFGSNGSIWVDYDLLSNPTVFREAWEMVNTSVSDNTLLVTGDLQFGDVAVGTSVQKTLRLTNNGTGTITVSSISVASPFSVNWTGGPIAAGTTKEVLVIYSPTATGTATQQVSINSDAINSTETVTATGNGISGTSDTRIISLPGSINFGNVLVGQSAAQTVVISNTGNAPLTVTSLTYSTPVFSGTWSGTIAPGSSQSVQIYFSPTLSAYYSGTLTVQCNNTGGVNTATLIGTGVQVSQTRVLSLSGDLYFGDIRVGSAGSTIETIRNDGNSPLTVSAVLFPDGFYGSWNGGVIAPGNAVSMTVSFLPTQVKPYNGYIIFTSDATSGPDRIYVSGNGTSASDPVVIPPIGTYAACAPGGSNVGCPLFSDGTITAQVSALNTTTHQVTVKIKKCDGTKFNYEGYLYVSDGLCSGTPYLAGYFPAGEYEYFLIFNDYNMTGTKLYYPYIIQGSNYSDAPYIVVSY